MSPTPPRVLSLLSASTEIVFRLGCGHLLVGRSHGCDDPPLATTLKLATAPKMDPNAGSREIDAAVRVQVDAGGPVYHIYSSVVAACKPTVILTQEQCRICAVTQADVEEACTGLPADTRIVTIKPVTLDDVLGDVTAIASALGVEARGARLAGHLRARIDAVDRTTGPLAAVAGRPKVVHLEWLSPLMGSGYWIAELVQAAGGEMLHGSAGGHAPTLSGLAVLADADVILLAPCGFSIERTHAELHSDALRGSLLQSAAWRALPAVEAGRVYVADGNKYFNRSSCGVAEAAEIFAELVWEDELCGLWGHHGARWVRMRELDAFVAREGAPPPTKLVVVEAQSTRPSKPSAAATLPRGAPPTAASAHVHAQIDAMRAADFERAFGLNSAANQSRLGSAATFASIVAGNASFAALAASAAGACVDDGGACAVAAAEGATGELHVALAATDGAPCLRFAFQLGSEQGPGGVWEWRTEGVGVVC